ncbi:MAG: pyridoxal-phosphate dependent enzyme [Gemmatimonadetes bacterium]|nr:pyridoxal-phosphate dependent enzyme [Gemmatimonadota bacterium]
MVEPTRDGVLAAAGRLADLAVRTPLIRFDDGSGEVWLKLESLQPIGSFKIRGAGNALGAADPGALASGVVTASAGNMAQGVAWCARARGIPCTVVVPDHAPTTKIAAIQRLGAKIHKVPFDRWWRVLQDRRFEGADGLFVHPVSDPAVIAGNATIGWEIAADLPNVDVVLAPFGGGGLSCGVAAGLAAAGSRARVVAVEPETAAPLAASWSAGEPRGIDYRPSFVDGAGGKSVLPEMWPLARRLLAGAETATLADTAAAVRVLAERARLVAEGAGALALAAARQGRYSGQRVVAIVSGGNIDSDRFTTILKGELPS